MRRWTSGRDPFRAEHDRARELAAARLAEPLDAHSAGWLADHLEWCAPCRAVVAEYEAQRVVLRALRFESPDPPRDLWALTSSRLEAEARGRRIRPERAGRDSRRIRSRQPLPVAPLAGLLVVVVAVGVSLLGAPTVPRPPAAGTPGPASAFPGATPIALTAREVPIVRRTLSGSLELAVGRFDEVCPLESEACGSTARVSREQVIRITAGPATDAVLSPSRSSLVVLDRGPGSSSAVYVVTVRDTPVPSQAPTPSADPGATPDASGSAPPSADPGATPGGSPGPSVAPSSPPASDPAPSTPPASPSTEPPASGDPSPGGASASPGIQPSPTVAVTTRPDGILEIADDVVVVGSAAAYAPDGSAFAFTARPADGRHGPDVYVWRPGDPAASPVTSDHGSLFADWVDGLLLVSRAETGAAGVGNAGVAAPRSVLIDPETGVTLAVISTPMWRPAVDPAGRTAVWWDGTVEPTVDGFGWQPSAGRLVLGDWQSGPGRGGAVAPTVLAAGRIVDWQVRWDASGQRLAVWVADTPGSSLGRLSLFRLDEAGAIEPGRALLRDVPAYGGFALDPDWLAWLEPAPEGATAVSIMAWDGEDVGRVMIDAQGGGPLAVVR